MNARDFILYFDDVQRSYHLPLEGEPMCVKCQRPIIDPQVQVIFSWRNRLEHVREILHLNCFRGKGPKGPYSMPLLTVHQNFIVANLCYNPPLGSRRIIFSYQAPVARRGDLSVFDLNGINRAHKGDAAADDRQLARLKSGHGDYTVLDDEAPAVIGDYGVIRRCLEDDKKTLTIAEADELLGDLFASSKRVVLEHEGKKLLEDPEACSCTNVCEKCGACLDCDRCVCKEEGETNE